VRYHGVMNAALLLADAILVTHVAFVLFVVGGQVLIMVGAFVGWGWVRNLWFRLAHLAAIGFVIVQAWFGEICPLTIWENDLRRSVGEQGYEGSFIAHWLRAALYYDFAPWVFVALYSAFGALVLAFLLIAPPRRRRA
jgi:hypothetical protein